MQIAKSYHLLSLINELSQLIIFICYFYLIFPLAEIVAVPQSCGTEGTLLQATPDCDKLLVPSLAHSTHTGIANQPAER